MKSKTIKKIENIAVGSVLVGTLAWNILTPKIEQIFKISKESQHNHQKRIVLMYFGYVLGKNVKDAIDRAKEKETSKQE